MVGERHTMTGLFCDLLRRHFATENNIAPADLRNLIWQKTDQTDILIEPAYKWRPELTQKRPGVLIKPNAMANKKIGLANLRQLPFVDRTGNKRFLTYWLGSHTIFCIASNGTKVELLANEVRTELSQFSEVIRSMLDLKQFGVIEVGAISILEEAQQNLVVPVTVGYAIEERWTVREQAPRLNRISLTAFIQD
jgi:hypothetical protein